MQLFIVSGSEEEIRKALGKVKDVQVCGNLLIQGKRATKPNASTGKGGGIPMLRVIPTITDSSGQVYGGRPLAILASTRGDGEESTALETVEF